MQNPELGQSLVELTGGGNVEFSLRALAEVDPILAEKIYVEQQFAYAMVVLATELGSFDQGRGYRTSVVVRTGKKPHPVLPDGTDPNEHLNRQITLDHSDRINFVFDAERMLVLYRNNPTQYADTPADNGKSGAFAGPSFSRRNKMIQLGSMPIMIKDIPPTEDPNTYRSDEIITRMLGHRGATEQELALMSIHAQRGTQVRKVIVSKSGDKANVALEKEGRNTQTGCDYIPASFSRFHGLTSNEPNFGNKPDRDHPDKGGVNVWSYVNKLCGDDSTIPVTVVDNDAITRVMDARTKAGLRIWQLPGDNANKTVSLYRKILSLK